MSSSKALWERHSIPERSILRGSQKVYRGGCHCTQENDVAHVYPMKEFGTSFFRAAIGRGVLCLHCMIAHSSALLFNNAHNIGWRRRQSTLYCHTLHIIVDPDFMTASDACRRRIDPRCQPGLTGTRRDLAMNSTGSGRSWDTASSNSHTD